MYTATVVGLWLSKEKCTKSLHSHDKQVIVAPCSYFLLHIALARANLSPTVLEKGIIVMPSSPKSTKSCEALGFGPEKKEIFIVLGTIKSL